eukprot:251709_1
MSSRASTKQPMSTSVQSTNLSTSSHANNIATSSCATNIATSSRATNLPTSSRDTNIHTASRTTNLATPSRATNIAMSSRATNISTSSRATKPPTSYRATNIATPSRAVSIATSSRATNLPTSTNDVFMSPTPPDKLTMIVSRREASNHTGVSARLRTDHGIRCVMGSLPAGNYVVAADVVALIICRSDLMQKEKCGATREEVYTLSKTYSRIYVIIRDDNIDSPEMAQIMGPSHDFERAIVELTLSARVHTFRAQSDEQCAQILASVARAHQLHSGGSERRAGGELRVRESTGVLDARAGTLGFLGAATVGPGFALRFCDSFDNVRALINSPAADLESRTGIPRSSAFKFHAFLRRKFNSRRRR